MAIKTSATALPTLPAVGRDRLLLGFVLGLSSAAALGMVAVRLIYSGTVAYAFMPWNLFLAWVPVALSVALFTLGTRASRPWGALVALGFLGLLFFPNAPYLVTEFIHLSPSHAPSQRPLRLLAAISPGRAVPVWYDALLIFACAWNGLLLGFVSLRMVQDTVVRIGGEAWGWAAVVGAIGLSSFGVSLGRFQRWNSWDLFSRPAALLADVLGRVLNPIDHARTTAVTVLLSGFLLLAYVSLAAVGGSREMRREEF